jgi:hypothetical protein
MTGENDQPVNRKEILTNNEVEIGLDKLHADAEVLSEALQAQIYAFQASRFPAFAGYQDKTARLIPVVALSPRRETAGRLTRGGPIPMECGSTPSTEDLARSSPRGCSLKDLRDE